MGRLKGEGLPVLLRRGSGEVSRVMEARQERNETLPIDAETGNSERFGAFSCLRDAEIIFGQLAWRGRRWGCWCRSRLLPGGWGVGGRLSSAIAVS